ncbi:putative glycoside hydrolase, family 76, six-hairpin glycosidase superfamily [Septoria linicola]|nr:putative glycoside hydrolase, family 76, six-hairpin glycosidase superfamily [Septoria linicola]
MKGLRVVTFLLITLLSASPIHLRDNLAGNLQKAYSELQRWYQQDTGVWLAAEWWQSANILTMLCTLAELDESYADDIRSVVKNTYNRAPSAHPDFLNDFYDDEGWWALCWIAAYDLTGDSQYLSTAEVVFADMATTFGQTSCSTLSSSTGGIWWDKAHTYVNTVANQLFIAVAASLANRVGGDRYRDLAIQQWTWLQATGLRNMGGLWNDGLDSDCRNNGSTTTWTYNQGVILGAALCIADAALSSLTQDGILQEPCEADDTCNADRSQFKGIFVCNLARLQKVAGKAEYADAIRRNADSIWVQDRSGDQFGMHWGGPFVLPANASTHSSAMDCLVAASAVQV